METEISRRDGGYDAGEHERVSDGADGVDWEKQMYDVRRLRTLLEPDDSGPAYYCNSETWWISTRTRCSSGRTAVALTELICASFVARSSWDLLRNCDGKIT